MNKRELIKKYKTGFTIYGSEPYMTEEWLLDEEASKKEKLVFIGYDANLFPARNLSERPKTKWKKKIIETALEFTKDFKGSVYLDDVKIKEVEAQHGE